MGSFIVLKKNLFDSKANYICHQVNCLGVMGSGVALQVKEKFPQVYNKYKTYCDTYRNELLGENLIVNVPDDTYSNGINIVNMFAQYSYTRTNSSKKRQTNYEAFYNCLVGILASTTEQDIIAFPYNIGCDRGGANWRIICTMIAEILKDRNVRICSLTDEYDEFVIPFINTNNVDKEEI